MKKFKNWLRKISPPPCGARRDFQQKSPGVVILIPTIILSGLILVVSVGLSQVLMTELEFSADLLFSEKAYFAAESGVEKSLLALKGKPLNYVDTNLWETEEREDLLVGTGANYELVIANSVDSFPFSLSENETVKFRLGIDDNPNFAGYLPELVRSFSIDISEGDESALQWKILCPQGNNTVALYGWGNNFDTGDYDDGEDIIENFRRNNFLAKIKEVCFMSLSFPERIPENNTTRSSTSFDDSQESRTISGTVSADKIAPAKVKITATGQSFSREKIVSFEYLQKNLSSKFDLGLYFTGE